MREDRRRKSGMVEKSPAGDMRSRPAESGAARITQAYSPSLRRALAA
jgi:hypothetical protein